MPYFGAEPASELANLDINGQSLILDADADTHITADTDDQIDIHIAGADDFQFTTNTFTAQYGSTIAAQALTATTVNASGVVGVISAHDLGTGLHIKTADSGGSVDAGADEIVVEGSGDSGITILSGASSSGSLLFADSGNTGDGRIVYEHNNRDLVMYTGNGEKIRMENDGGAVIINPGAATTTSNASMGTGLTIQQAGSDNEILALKSTDVAHGLTSYTETDTYAAFRKQDATNGGLLIYAMSESGNQRAIQISGFAAGTDTTKSTSASGVIDIRASKTSGTGGAVLTGNANAVVFYASGDAKFLIDQEGDYHYDGADGSAFDTHHDSELVSTFNSILGTNSDRPDWNRMKRMSDLKLLGSVTPEEWDEGVRPLVNGSQMQRLLVGTAAQSWVREQVRDTILANLIPGYKEAVAALADGKNVGAMPEVLQG